MTDQQRDAIREALARLYQQGRLTPTNVVRAAKNSNSPLHDCFEWDDGAAAQQWREEQARALIRAVPLEIRTETVTIRTVAYVRDPNAAADEQGYISVEALRDDKKAARAALIYECGRVLASMDRTRGLALALGLLPEAEVALAGVTTLRQKAAA